MTGFEAASAYSLYSAVPAVPEAHPIDGVWSRSPFGTRFDLNRRRVLKPEEIRKLTAYFKRVFQNPNIDVKARPRKEDSAEVYVGDEFIGLVYKDEEDGDYNFSMAILDIDLN
jgi:hypothetical protein